MGLVTTWLDHYRYEYVSLPENWSGDHKCTQIWTRLDMYLTLFNNNWCLQDRQADGPLWLPATTWQRVVSDYTD